MGCPRAGSTGSLQLARIREQTRPPCHPSPLPRRVHARRRQGRGRARGSVWGGRRGREWRRQEFLCLRLGRFLALAKWAGDAGISMLGEGIPRQSGGRGLGTGSGEGECPQYVRTSTHASPSCQPGNPAVGHALKLLRGGVRGAGLRPPRPLLALDAQLTPRRPLHPRVPVRSQRRDGDLSGKSISPPGGLRGPLAHGLALAFLRISPEVGRGREPQRGTSRSAHVQHGAHPPWVPEAETRASPGSLPHAGTGPSSLPRAI